MSESTTAARAEDILQTLKGVIDPELGLSIVELGMVRAAAWRNSDIEVAITPTSASCPLTQLIVDDAEHALRDRFPDAISIRIDLVWDPPWSAECLSKEARRLFGLPTGEAD